MNKLFILGLSAACMGFGSMFYRYQRKAWADEEGSERIFGRTAGSAVTAAGI